MVDDNAKEDIVVLYVLYVLDVLPVSQQNHAEYELF